MKFIVQCLTNYHKVLRMKQIKSNKNLNAVLKLSFFIIYVDAK